MGIQQAMLARSGGASGGIVSPLGGGGGSTSIAGNITVGTDGKISFTGTLVNNWYSPTTTGIGSSYWCRITKSSGDTEDLNTASTWAKLDAARFVEYSTNLPKSGAFLIEISSDASGTPVVTSGTYTMTVS